VLQERDRIAVYPAKHFIVSHPRLENALEEIEKELEQQVDFLITMENFY
jgi:excinuclease UvrABC helicase subunit UvrB